MKLNNIQDLMVIGNYIKIRVTAEFEINDYPTHARKKVCESEFLCSITDMTNAEVKIRGQYVDKKSKVPPEARKLFL